MERKDLQFGVKKIQHQWYFHFDLDTGMVNSMSVNKQDIPKHETSTLALMVPFNPILRIGLQGTKKAIFLSFFYIF